MRTSDVLIVGGGPAGLSAAINAASEGLSVRLIDSGPSLGGQPRDSNAIENYPGAGRVTGAAIMGAFVDQAYGFGVEVECPVTVAVCQRDRSRTLFYAMDGTCYSGRVTILTPGLSHNTLSIPGMSRLLGRGVSYGMAPADANGRTVALVGGGNSAGQAAERLLAHGSRVHMIVRRRPSDTMSAYLLDRLAGRVTFHNADVLEVTGTDWLNGVVLQPRKAKRPVTVPVDRLAIFAGAAPHTFWLSRLVNLDARGYIVTGANGALPYETSIKGVFAAGDARSGAVKRIAAAVGEGSSVVALGVHSRIK